MTTTQQILERLQYIEHAPLACWCGESDGTQYAASDRHGIDTMLRVCGRCGTVRTDPAPDDASLARFYANDYRALYDDGGPDALWAQQVDTGKTLLAMLDLGPCSVVIDYGCGIGGVLKPFQDAGHRVIGIEPGEYASRGRELLGPCIYPDTVRIEDGCADVVIALHTIEHRRDLAAALADHRRLLKPGGLLVCEVPTLETIDTHYKTLRNYLQIPHVWHFSERTIMSTLRAAGFGTVKVFAGRCVVACKVPAAWSDVTTLDIAAAEARMRVLTDSIPPTLPDPPSALSEFARWFEGAPIDDLRISEDELRAQAMEIDGMRQRLLEDVDAAATAFKRMAGERVARMDHDVIAAAEYGAYMQSAQMCCDLLTVARAELMLGGGQ